MKVLFPIMRKIKMLACLISLWMPVCAVSCSMLLAGCEKSSGEHRGGNPENGGRDEPPVPPSDADSTQRPGILEQDYDFSKELNSDAWRYTGNGIELGYENGGVLFNTDKGTSKRSVEIIDLDGGTRVSCRFGSVSSDSVVSGATLTVNSAEVGVERMLFKKVSLRSEWYHIITDEPANLVLVIPSD